MNFIAPMTNAMISVNITKAARMFPPVLRLLNAPVMPTAAFLSIFLLSSKVILAV